MKVTLPLYPRPNKFNSNGYLIPKIPLDIELNKFMQKKHRAVTLTGLPTNEYSQPVELNHMIGVVESIDMSGDTYTLTANLQMHMDDDVALNIINNSVFGMKMYASSMV